MRHIFGFIWENILHHAQSFRNQFIAGGLAGTGILLRISAPDTLTLFAGLWILIKAAGIGAATAMGGMFVKTVILEYRKHRKKKRHERSKKQLEEDKRKERA